MDTLIQSLKHLLRIYDLPSRKSLQTGWIKVLLRNGTTVDTFQSMDAKQKSHIDPDGSVLLRSLSLAVELGVSKDQDSKLDMESKTGIKELVLRFVQLAKINMEELQTFPGLSDSGKQFGELCTALESVLVKKRETMEALRKKASAAYESFGQIVNAATSWTEAVVVVFYSNRIYDIDMI